MRQLNSKNYHTVRVTLKDGTINMPARKGDELMQFLTSDNNISHIMITDVNGKQSVVNKYEIKSVAPLTAESRYKTPQELGMPELSVE